MRTIQVRGSIAVAAMLAAAILGALVGSAATALTGRSIVGAASRVPILVAEEQGATAGAVSFSAGFWPVAERAAPAVVNISSSKVVRSPESGPAAPFFLDPFFRDFFGDRFPSMPRERRERSLGSGVIVSPEGYILTNNHVVEGATEIRAALTDRREFPAKLVGADPKTDIAVIKVDQKDLPAITIGDSGKVNVGNFVVAIGNPFGIGQTVTLGIVSATGRGRLGIEDYEDFIQTDAAINPGNSGGALTNVRGELVGINTAILAPGGGGNQGIGFAVPVNMARHVMEQILKHGRVVRGWLGVSIQEVTPAIAQAMGLKEARGALVAEATPNSPAAKGGLAAGDVIVELNGEPVADERALQLKIGTLAPGSNVKLKVLREGREREVNVTLGEAPSDRQRAATPEGDQAGSALRGLAVDELSPQIARQLNLPANTRGVVVVQVRPGTPAGEAGLQRGDVIQQVDRKPVGSVSEFQSMVRQAGANAVLLLVNRGGSTRFVVVEP
jgi:serine protease Do